jgi:hypothetical protein
MRRAQRGDGKVGQLAALGVPRCSPAARGRLAHEQAGIGEMAFLAQKMVRSAHGRAAARAVVGFGGRGESTTIPRERRPVADPDDGACSRVLRIELRAQPTSGGGGG